MSYYRRFGVVLAFTFSVAPTFAPRAIAQESAAVTVADSPVAWQLFQQALDQARDNPAEAARLCQRLLDGFTDRVVPSDDPPGDRYESVLERVERFLRERPSVLERYRQVEGPEADRLSATAKPEVVARLRGLTRAGLRAHLKLAERDFLTAEFDRVRSRLERMEGHPDLTDGVDASAYWFLRGASSALTNDGKGRDEALARLAGLSSDEARVATNELARIAQLEPAEVPTVTSVLSGGAAPPDVSEDDRGLDLAWQPIWSVPLPGTPFSRNFLGTGVATGAGAGAEAGEVRAVPARGPQANPNPFLVDLNAQSLPRQFERARYDGSMLSVAPAVATSPSYTASHSPPESPAATPL